jgi:hypothetical protein
MQNLKMKKFLMRKLQELDDVSDEEIDDAIDETEEEVMIREKLICINNS